MISKSYSPVFSNRQLARFLLVLLLCGFSSSLWAQQILLDKQVPAGELLLYPEYKNEQNYYYLPNKPRLALDAEGRPQFSFIRFVRNSETGAEDSSTSRSSDGGGIVTALVELGVTEEQRNQAQQELQSLVPGAIIKGAVTYDSGKFSLNSVYADANGDRTEQVLGIGSAPLMEGNKAAISLDLTTKGAQQLWASFDMPSPNITFYFEMQFNGLLSPSQAVIEADYEKIYSHHALNVGAAGQVGKVLLGAEIDAAFKDLHRENAIRIDYVNADADMIAMTQIADKFIRDTIFKPMNENNQKLPGIEAATGGVAGAAGGQGLLDKATTLLKEAQATADAIRGKERAKPAVAEQCEPVKEPSGAAAAADKSKSGAVAKPAAASDDKSDSKTTGASEGDENSATSNYQRLMNGDLSDEHLGKLGLDPPQGDGVAAAATWAQGMNHSSAENHNEAISEFRNAYNLQNDSKFILVLAHAYSKLSNYTEALRHWKAYQAQMRFLKFESRLALAQAEINILEKKLAEQKGGSSENVSAQAGDSDDKAKPAKAASPAAKKADCKPTKAKAAKAAEDNRPVLSIVARYQFRSEKQSGMYYMKINKYTNGTLNDNFAENIGDLSRLKDDEQFFRTVNLDDDLAYDQREIVVMLNGLNSSDFDNFINFASVKLRKRHESGAETIDDVRIDKANIDRAGNKFILLYGNKGDTNRERWLDYEFQTTWNFAGGHQEGDDAFQQSNGEAIALNPPIERLPLQIDADPDLLAAANVRAVDVKVFWTIGDQTDSEQVLLRLPNTSAIVPMLAPANSFGYEFEITWMRGGGLPDLRSGRQAGSSSILFVDDLPGE